MNEPDASRWTRTLRGSQRVHGGFAVLFICASICQLIGFTAGGGVFLGLGILLEFVSYIVLATDTPPED